MESKEEILMIDLVMKYSEILHIDKPGEIITLCNCVSEAYERGTKAGIKIAFEMLNSKLENSKEV